VVKLASFSQFAVQFPQVFLGCGTGTVLRGRKKKPQAVLEVKDIVLRVNAMIMGKLLKECGDVNPFCY